MRLQGRYADNSGRNGSYCHKLLTEHCGTLEKTIVSVADCSGIAENGISQAYVNDVKSAYAYGIINEVEGSTFCPKNTLTKAQAAAVVNRIAEKLRY